MSRATTSGYPKADAKAKKKNVAPASEKFDYSRTQPMNAQDPRAEGAPCWGHHVVAAPGPGSVTGSNNRATWEGCEVCRLRLSYTPAYGAHGLTRAAGPLAKDVERQLEKVPANEQKNSIHLKDTKIGLDGAEESLLQKLDEVQQKKKQWQETSKGTIASQGESGNSKEGIHFDLELYDTEDSETRGFGRAARSLGPTRRGRPVLGRSGEPGPSMKRQRTKAEFSPSTSAAALAAARISPGIQNFENANGYEACEKGMCDDNETSSGSENHETSNDPDRVHYTAEDYEVIEDLHDTYEFEVKELMAAIGLHPERRREIDGQLHEARVDGCSYGLKVDDGYLKKPWLLRGTTPLIWNLAKRCPGNRKRVPCEGGQRTRMSAFYPKAMAKRVWHLVRMIYEEATRWRPEAQTAWYLDEIDENQ
ncbi:unnamed protein product, partial [Durusdinium trenchii]